jgi:hypothetical protein
MGAYLFVIVCTAIWIAFGWVLAARPIVLDHTWGRVRGLPLLAKPVAWVAFFPWLTGLAVWESRWAARAHGASRSRWWRSRSSCSGHR